MSTAPAGLLIVGHGTRDERGCAAFAQVVRGVAALHPDAVVEGSFLELVEPDIATGIERVIARGAQRLAVVPLLLVAAGHARRDVPRQIAAAAARFPDVSIRQTPHLGSHEAILELSERRYREALVRGSAQAPEETLLIVVGRGTRDAEANAELCAFARRRQERTPVGWTETCFLSMTEPSLVRALDVARQMPFRRVVVQPHFLFPGELLDRVGATVAEAATRTPEKEYLVVDCLGADELLVRAVAKLGLAAC